jgi:uncharacterized protein (TIGR04255 family)
MASEFPHYEHAPLTEAVIELRFQEALPEKVLEQLRKRFAGAGWRQEQLLEFEFTLGQSGQPRQSAIGYKFSSDDGVRVIQVQRQSVACSMMAPYPGWEAFTAFLFETYATWKKEASRRLTRIGVRYINRLDIPMGGRKVAQIEDYLTFRLIIPSALDRPMDNYSISISSGVTADNLLVNVNSAVIPSPLIDHVGLQLDIDLYRAEVDVPQNDSDIKALLDVIRRRRTEIFDQCLTSASRALIS